MSISKSKKYSLWFVGIFALLLSIFGIYYTYNYFEFYAFSDLRDYPNLQEIIIKAPYFYHFYYLMVTICTVFYLWLFYIAIQVLRMDSSVKKHLLLLIASEFIYSIILMVPVMFLMDIGNQDIVMSFGAAFGVANGGLVPQAVSLFPIWAPVILFWAHSNKALNSDVEHPPIK